MPRTRPPSPPEIGDVLDELDQGQHPDDYDSNDPADLGCNLAPFEDGSVT